MIREFEYEGKWWLPGRPQNEIMGMLKFTPWKGAILKLNGSLKDTKSIFEPFEPEIILGVSSTGKNITLYKCLETKSDFSSPGYPTSSIHANIVFVGSHFPNSQDIHFGSMYVRYSYLDEWVNISGFDIESFPQEKRAVIRYKLPEPRTAVVGNDLKVSINFLTTISPREFVQTEASIKQSTQIEIETAEEKPFQECTRAIYHFQNFLSLAVMEPTYVLSLKGKTKSYTRVIGEKAYRQPIEIFYNQLYVPGSGKELLADEMLFTFRQIENRFGAFLASWFEKRQELEPVYNLYFSTLYDSSSLEEHRFLSFVHSLEALHERVHGGTYLAQEKYMENVYAPLVDAIPDGVGSDLKESLRTRIRYGNEFSLRKRLRELYDKHQLVLDKFIENKNNFIESVVETRNYLIHHDKDLEEQTSRGIALYELSQKLKKLVEICLLSQMGFRPVEIKSVFIKNRRYRQQLVRKPARKST